MVLLGDYVIDRLVSSKNLGPISDHESPRRGETVVTRKITRWLANVAQGLELCLYTGNLYEGSLECRWWR